MDPHVGGETEVEAVGDTIAVVVQLEGSSSSNSLERGQRKRTYWICPGSSTRTLTSASAEVVKVCLFCIFSNHLLSSCNTNLRTRSSITVRGTLKGYDQLMNLVLDDVHEVMRGEMISCLPRLFHVVQAFSPCLFLHIKYLQGSSRFITKKIKINTEILLL